MSRKSQLRTRNSQVTMAHSLPRAHVLELHTFHVRGERVLLVTGEGGKKIDERQTVQFPVHSLRIRSFAARQNDSLEHVPGIQKMVGSGFRDGAANIRIMHCSLCKK